MKLTKSTTTDDGSNSGARTIVPAHTQVSLAKVVNRELSAIDILWELQSRLDVAHLTTRSKRLLGRHLDSTAARGQCRDGTV
jgi:hypothetical protein